LISVIIPTYNRAGLIGRAVESVLSQTYADWELWIVDDGSTDETARAVQPYLTDARVHWLHIDHTGLPACARNAGMRKAQGEFIAFLDSDDRWLPEKLALQIEQFTNQPTLVLAWSNAVFIADDQSPERPYFDQPLRLEPDPIRTMIAENPVITSTAMIRTAVLIRTGLFWDSPAVFAYEDYDFWLRVASCGEVRYLPRPLAIYYRYGQGLLPHDRFDLIKRRINVLRNFRQWTNNDLHQSLADQNIRVDKRRFIKHALMNGEFRKAWEIAWH